MTPANASAPSFVPGPAPSGTAVREPGEQTGPAIRTYSGAGRPGGGTTWSDGAVSRWAAGGTGPFPVSGREAPAPGG